MARDAGGKIHPISLLESESPSSPDSHPASPSTQAANNTPWQFNLGELSVDDFGFAIRNQGQAGELAYDLDDITLSIRNIANSGTTPVSYKLGTKIRQGGALTVAGTASPKGDTAKAKEYWKKAQVALDKAVQKKVIHKNTAARTKSRLNKLVKNIAKK